jgi:3-isopropylmalate dehydrogenase
MKSYNICVIKGDGIGPEIADEAIKVLDSVSAKFNFELNYEYYLMGGAAIDVFGEPLPDETLNGARKSDAVLFGAIGGEKWDNLPRHLRPESGLLKLRKSLNAYANLRPAMIYDELINASTLKAEVIKGVDILVVRELTGGLYFGQPREKLEDRAYNTMTYTVSEIERIAKIAFEAAMKRRKKVCMVDKANVLETSQLWREVTAKVAQNYPDVTLEYMYVDNAAMQLVRYPTGFDVILTENLFGDILSDEASMVCGSIGLLPSASMGGDVGIYEPIHGSAPDIAGQGIANPIAMILSAAMMLRYALGENEAADCIENAIKAVLKDGYRTKDIAKFDAEFDLVSGRYVIDAKSIMGIFSLDISQPIDLNIHADGDDTEILKALEPYII